MTERVQLTFKRGEEEFELEVDSQDSIRHVADLLADRCGLEGAPRLICRGRILAQEISVREAGLKCGDIVFFAPPAPTQSPSPPPPGRHPISTLLRSSMMDSLLANPDLFTWLLEVNPTIQQLRARSPEFNALFQDPSALRETVTAMRNPAVMREMMRTTDRAMNNIDAVPGGFDALRQIYNEVQDWPLTDSPPVPPTAETPEYTLPNQETDDPFPQAWPQSLPMPRAPSPPGFCLSVPSRPEEPSLRFHTQYQTIRGMGFEDDDAILEALSRHNGNINKALDDLTGNR